MSRPELFDAVGAAAGVLAHLIRLPQQTHMKVVRFDQDLKDPLPAESELAHRIATEFFRRLDASPRSAKN